MSRKAGPQPAPKLQIVVRRPADLSDVELADEYGDLAQRCAAMKPSLDRLKALKEEVAARLANTPAEDSAQLEGRCWRLQVGPKRLERRFVSMAAVLKAMTPKRFLEACSIAIKAVEAVIGADKTANLLTEERTGYREVTPVLVVPAEAAKKVA